ncbi:starvation responsive small protein [Dictyostelium discoideum AX4]|uniref:Isoform 2 of Starvation responsive small protein A n=1 Tax=Dictyostelium discoideum TaxID=44689 RepID=B0G168-2|nr:starvation responsive small protein [Dictyostelium discoideum AX4]EDR41042.1 starvation responsive small protein [Dictyostelium discoideum AX4]BAF47287.1 starvation responsive small protein A [Dictyostelium discoideum]|eukprot:XP_001733032.1 starvation responsive small protein [Dictyostelium discoideum AX4]
MIAKVFKSITPESYILLVNAGLISAYGVRIIFQSVKNDEGKNLITNFFNSNNNNKKQ